MHSGRTATCRAWRVCRPANPAVIDPDTHACLRIALQVEASHGRGLRHRLSLPAASADRRSCSAGDDSLSERVRRGRRRDAGSGRHRQRLRTGSPGRLAGRLGPRLRAAAGQPEHGLGTSTASRSGRLGGPVGHTRPDGRSVPLSSSALSGSGSDVKGPHIIDPRAGRPALAPSAGFRPGRHGSRGRRAVHRVRRDDRARPLRSSVTGIPRSRACVVPADEAIVARAA